MTTWADVGGWLKDNAGTGAALVGSLLTGNVPGAVAAGVALVGSATGSPDPGVALAKLQVDPATMIRLKELAVQEEAAIRAHVQAMTEAQMRDAQAEHEQTQETIRSGDNAEDVVVRRTRPLQSWLSLIGALAYVFLTDAHDVTILGLLLTLPWAYAGLRQIGKGVDTWAASREQKSPRG